MLLVCYSVFYQAISGVYKQELELVSFWQSCILAGFLLANTLYFRQLFSRIDKLEVITMLWRLFIIGMVGIAVILILILFSRLAADLNSAPFLNQLFYYISLYAMLIFFLSAIFIYRRFIMYQKNRSKIIG